MFRILDNSPIMTADDSSFWSSSPRSDTPSPNSTLQNPLVSPYYHLTPVRVGDNREPQFRTTGKFLF